MPLNGKFISISGLYYAAGRIDRSASATGIRCEARKRVACIKSGCTGVAVISGKVHESSPWKEEPVRDRKSGGLMRRKY